MEGWNINEKLALEFFEDQKLPSNSKEIEKVLIDEDLREYGEPVFQNLIDKTTTVLNLSKSIVVQLVKYRNVQIPKVREDSENYHENSGIFRIFLTDGHSTISGIIMENIKGLSTETPPGTKIRLSGNIPIESNFLLFSRLNLQIIGGNVEKLVEKWRIERGGGEKTAKTASLAPKWIPFGKKAKQVQQLDKNFKANQVLPKNEIDETTDFAKNREEVLKNLGDDKKDQKVFSRPNVEVPLPQIQKTVPQNKPKKNTEDNNINKKKQRRGRKNSEDDDTPLPDYVKPGAAPTLFDFIGATTGLEDEIKNIQITRQQNTPRGNRSEPQNFSSGNRNSHGPREKQENPRGNFGNNPRKKRNDQRTSTSGNSENPTSSGFRGNRNDGLGKPNNFQENRQQQQKFPEKKREDQQRGNSSRVENNQQNRNNKAQNYQHQDKYPNRNQNFASNQGSGRSDVAGNQGNRQQGNRQQQQQYGNQQNRDVSNRNTQNQRVAQSHHQPAQSTFNPNQQPPRPSVWQIGSQCMAPWEDGRIYPAQIMNILPNGTCVIRYTEYGNITEIPLDFLMYC